MKKQTSFSKLFQLLGVNFSKTAKEASLLNNQTFFEKRPKAVFDGVDLYLDTHSSDSIQSQLENSDFAKFLSQSNLSTLKR